MEILTHLRFTMNLKVRCEQAQQWNRSIRTHAYRLWLVITTLLEIILESSSGKLEKDYFLCLFLLRTNIFGCSRILSPGSRPTVSSPFDIWWVHSPWHALILFKSEWKPSIWACLENPLRKGQESKNSDMFEVFSNMPCRAFLSDCLCSSW